MTISTVRPGDIVLVDRKGRRFHAIVAGDPMRGSVEVTPIDPRVSYYSAKAREIVGHWRRSKAGTG
jgi:hypothetical protein